MTRVWSGRTAGHGASGLDGLVVWLTTDGYALSTRLPDGSPAILASSSSSPDSSGVSSGARAEPVGAAGLAGLVPPGFALLVDGATPGRRVVAASVVEGLAVAEPPDGCEPDLQASPVPQHLRPVVARAVTAAEQAGARGGGASWMTGGGRAGLWLDLYRAPAAAWDAAFAAVEAEAPREPVRLLEGARLSGGAQTVFFEGVDVEQRGPEGERPFSRRFDATVLVVVVVGALLVVLGREQGGTAGTLLPVLGWTVEAAVVVGVLVTATRRGAGPGWRPLPLLGLAAVGALLVWQAVRGLA